MQNFVHHDWSSVSTLTPIKHLLTERSYLLPHNLSSIFNPSNVTSQNLWFPQPLNSLIDSNRVTEFMKSKSSLCYKISSGVLASIKSDKYRIKHLLVAVNLNVYLKHLVKYLGTKRKIILWHVIHHTIFRNYVTTAQLTLKCNRKYLSGSSSGIYFRDFSTVLSMSK